MKKNVASQKIGAQVLATDGSAFTGSVTVYVTGDAGTQAVGSVGSGACTHEGNGYHTYAPAQAETNYDLIAFTFTGTGAAPVTVQVYTGFPQSVDNATNIAAILADTGTDGVVIALPDGPVPALGIVEGGTAQSATSTTLVMRSGAVHADNTLRGCICLAYGSTQGYWQAGVITANTLSNDTLTVAFPVTPSGTITYRVFGTPESSSALPMPANITQVAGSTTDVAALATNVAAILADTAEIGTAGAGLTEAGGTGDHLTAVASQTSVNTIDDFLDTEVAAIKAKTDQLAFSAGGKVAADVLEVKSQSIGAAKPYNTAT